METFYKDIDFLRRAYKYASAHSDDPNTQNGAIIVARNNEKLKYAYGANNFPQGVSKISERLERPMKYQFIEHAERNAIFDAARRGIKTTGAIMYCPWYACAECSRAIIQAGIVEVVGHETPIHKEANPMWHDSIKVALDMLDEAGIKRRYIEGPIGGIEIRFNGQIVRP